MRAPQTTWPEAANVRRQLTPSGLRIPLSPSVSFAFSSWTPPIPASSPAGAFQTPRDASMRAITPAIVPQGGKSAIVSFCSGSGAFRYGK